jgi:hypothetical protein
MTCSLVSRCWSFRVLCCLYFLNFLKLEVVWLSEALVTICQTTRHHIPENSNLQLRVWSYFIMKLNCRRNKNMSGNHEVEWPVSGHVVPRNWNRTLISGIYVSCFAVFPTFFGERKSFKVHIKIIFRILSERGMQNFYHNNFWILEC